MGQPFSLPSLAAWDRGPHVTNSSDQPHNRQSRQFTILFFLKYSVFTDLCFFHWTVFSRVHVFPTPVTFKIDTDHPKLASSSFLNSRLTFRLV